MEVGNSKYKKSKFKRTLECIDEIFAVFFQTFFSEKH